MTNIVTSIPILIAGVSETENDPAIRHVNFLNYLDSAAGVAAASTTVVATTAGSSEAVDFSER